ncbi:MAG: Repressor in ring oxydation complex/ phenylacetic acid degradation pathway related protein (PaaX) [Parcubacteria group bacterium GW2011_GWB1_35_5]|uniref:Transcriptional repressor PaaX-like central Cas2-like domain-containing protein n=1 Tax=Candidatus Zambryskibacteria bacterium RIFCSPLOWO2_01_FULL_35_19 TaxID=1802757 RepID=A0A1G2TYA1_9BACT|nr:MAG: Repressor in ring oxydation complex/ phenylacetic acid degradation pathway related protein (PaaX) [Parcubacteria group bacterium GW2011_GWC1_34_10]KKP80480.1 MAG: Repressor in ring oxydation complex/ phenylacetic acid degradation pathway related protein (PaaX) [Parcubacteria group bacterium GW2011_GWB1_35_5]OHA85877.1 MAG: hypothetical protein A2726_02405 [Candidatus Zambryskibacteria bacterium RIFCSPHIGHO2_01_FULL_35_32]OHB02276.1 MAG: hypothetical protein A3A90_00540 [Candidatus Zambry
MPIKIKKEKVGKELEISKGLEKKSKRKNLQNIILQTVYVAGVIGVGLVAPNVLLAMKKIGLISNFRQKESINISRNRLIKRGMLVLQNGKLKITKKGKLFLLRNTFYKNKKIKKEKWDGKWRVLIFDIPESLRFIRDQIRATLVAVGFKRLQDSVWIYPYNCEDLIILLKTDLEIGKDLLYMIVDTLEDDEEIKNYFGLK